MNNYIKPERILLKTSPNFTKKWVQQIIAEDPSVLGLGELGLRDQERIQPRAGRLDLLLQDSDRRRYEVELQLGATDEAHIIRTIEYWDIERKRYPQYDHCAVLIAEDITSRFLNVISLFNGTIPLIALQMQAMKVGDQITLIFTTVVNELVRGLVDEDEDAESEPTDRNYWEARASKATVHLADDLLQIVHRIDPTLQLKYNKFYIGLSRDGQPNNFVSFKPKKNWIILEVGLPQSDDLDAKIENAGIETLEYVKSWRRYRLKLTPADIAGKTVALEEIIKQAYDYRNS